MKHVQGKQPDSFTATQPLLAASIVPVFLVTVPVFMLFMNSIESEGRPWLIGGYLVLIIALAIMNFVFVNKRRMISIEEDKLLVGNRVYPADDIKKLEVRDNSRYLNIYLKHKWGAIGYHIREQDEFKELKKRVQKWSSQHKVEWKTDQNK
ncbi:hypothetical protein [Bacillus horti]|uniref:Uncharacterized protein n=1 Tax=Caldalkalibacillus horti TaxID=77523 RepID=A0ABT9VV78_9BACI|nr:hypothetical protein [Bacillus horti]MDQ0164893.1 hypothetical protein [Bacillus horti]